MSSSNSTDLISATTSTSASSSSDNNNKNNNDDDDSPTFSSSSTSSSTLAASASASTVHAASSVDAPDHEHGKEPDAPIHKFCSQRFDKDLLEDVMKQQPQKQRQDEEENGGDNSNNNTNSNGSSGGGTQQKTNKQVGKDAANTNGKVSPPDTINEQYEDEEQEQRQQQEDGDDHDKESLSDKQTPLQEVQESNVESAETEIKDGGSHQEASNHEEDVEDMAKNKNGVVTKEEPPESSTGSSSVATSSVAAVAVASNNTYSSPKLEQKTGGTKLSEGGSFSLSPNPFDRAEVRVEEAAAAATSLSSPAKDDVTEWLGQLADKTVNNSRTGTENQESLSDSHNDEQQQEQEQPEEEDGEDKDYENLEEDTGKGTAFSHGDGTDPTPPSVSELSTTSAGQRDAHLAGLLPPDEIVASSNSNNHHHHHHHEYHQQQQQPSTSSTATTNIASSSALLTTTSVAQPPAAGAAALATTQQHHLLSQQLELSPIETDPLSRSSVRSSTGGGVGTGGGLNNNNSHQIPPGYVLAHPEVGIPTMPPLILPQPQSSQQHNHLQQQHLQQQQQQQQFQQSGQYSLQPTPRMSHTTPTNVLISTNSGRSGKRRIHLRLVEENTSLIPSSSNQPERSLFSSFRRRRSSINSPIHESQPTSSRNHWVERGTLTVSWYDGTSSSELLEHVRNSVVRKLGLERTMRLDDFRILDESMDPPEEIVLCPFIPNESRLLLRFKMRDAGGDKTPSYVRSDDSIGPPESPSAAPSPHPKLLHGLDLNANQLALLGSRLQGLQPTTGPTGKTNGNERKSVKVVTDGKKGLLKPSSVTNHNSNTDEKDTQDEKSQDSEDDSHGGNSNMEVASLHPEDQIQKSLREITELLVSERSGKGRNVPRQERRQVIFVLANYFVLFLSLIAISAEIQARAPGWNTAMERQLQNVQDCSKDKESLFQCVENGDMAGLVASVLLWVSRSAATKRIFLFGFESPQKLWTVVYESLVTAVCWGFSYMFIRRGMNPDTSHRFLQKYWKDAIYGSLAGFNAAFMKHVLKNLIPQEAIEDALQDKGFRLHFLSWLPSSE